MEFLEFLCLRDRQAVATPEEPKPELDPSKEAWQSQLRINLAQLDKKGFRNNLAASERGRLINSCQLSETDGSAPDKLLLRCQVATTGAFENRWALVDTGAQVTVAHARTFGSLTDLRPSDIAMVAANDSQIPIKGMASLRLAIGRTRIVAEVYVTECLIEDLVLGMDLLWTLRVDILCSRAVLRLGPRKCRDAFAIVSRENKGWITRLRRIKNDSNQELAPGRRIIYEIKSVAIEVNKKFLGQTGLDHSVACEGQKKVLILTNNTKSPKRIKKNQMLAVYDEAVVPGLEEECRMLQASRRSVLVNLLGFNSLHVGRLEEANPPSPATLHEIKIDPVICDGKGRRIVIHTHKEECERLNKAACEVVRSRLHAFSTEMRPAKTIPGKFQIKDKNPIRRRSYKTGVVEGKIMRRIAQEMTNGGVMRRENGAYESPCFLKKKPNGEFRLLVNYKELNEKIVKTHDRVPRLEQIWAALRDMRYFSTLDLNQGFFQIPLDESVKEYTGINIGGVGYVFNCIPQGLSASPGIFQSTMTNIFHDIIFEKCIVYMDDICVFGKTLEETIENTAEVMDRLIKYDLRLKASKCSFFAKSIELLGHRITYNKMEPLDKNIKPVLDANPPTTLKKLQSFLGAANYIRNFVKDFSRVVAPLTNLLGKEGHDEKGKLKWGKEAQEAFDEVKRRLTTTPVLALFDPKAETLLEVDASKVALGGVMIQIDPQTKKRHPVAYFSQKVPKCKQHLCSFDLEMMAITEACEYLREYLLNIEFTIFTDHQPLTYQANFKKPTPRVARMVSKLGEYSFKIKHIKGEQNKMADYLSRKDEEFCEFKGGSSELKKETIQAITRGAAKKKEEFKPDIVKAEEGDENFEELKLGQTKDEFWGNMIKFLKGEIIENVSQNEKSKIKKMAPDYYIDDENGVLYKHTKDEEYFTSVPVIPTKMIPDIIKILHDDRISGGHHGYKKTLSKIRKRYFFLKMPTEVKNYVLSCHECQTNKNNPEKYGKLKPMPIKIFKPMEHLEIDFMGKFQNESEKKYVIVAIDKATKYCFVKPVTNPNARAVIKFLKNIMINQGKPNKITCDNGTHFLNSEVHQFCEENGIKIFHSTSYAPQTQGQVERMNGVLKKQLAKFKASESEEWDDYIKEAAFVYNTTPIEGLKNRTPFYLMHGYEAEIPSKIKLPQAKTNLDREEQIEKANQARREVPKLDQKNAEKYSAQYNKGRKMVEFEKNDLVLLRNSKLRAGEAKFLGPYRVVKKLNELNYVIQIITENGQETYDTVHVRRLSRYIPRKGMNEPALVMDAGEQLIADHPKNSPIKIKRGRPKKELLPEKPEGDRIPKRRPGRPRKNLIET